MPKAFNFENCEGRYWNPDEVPIENTVLAFLCCGLPVHPVLSGDKQGSEVMDV